jgi:hypothetical protein
MKDGPLLAAYWILPLILGVFTLGVFTALAAVRAEGGPAMLAVRPGRAGRATALRVLSRQGPDAVRPPMDKHEPYVSGTVKTCNIDVVMMYRRGYLDAYHERSWPGASPPT